LSGYSPATFAKASFELSIMIRFFARPVSRSVAGRIRDSNLAYSLLEYK
jgi:hypothetical protein